MPIKPTTEEINACKVKIDPKLTLEVLINETPELKAALSAAGLIIVEEEE